MIVAGQGTKGARLIETETGIDGYTLEGKALNDPAFGINWETSGYQGDDGGNPACGVNDGEFHTADEWEAGERSYSFISSPKADGYSRDFVARCGTGALLDIEGNIDVPVLLFDEGVRMDSATYLGSRGAAVFDRTVPVMSEYSRTSTEHGEVGQHVFTAQTDPGSTYPPPPAGQTKSIPGSRTPSSTGHRPE